MISINMPMSALRCNLDVAGLAALLVYGLRLRAPPWILQGHIQQIP